MKLLVALVFLGVLFESQCGIFDGITDVAKNIATGITNAGNNVQNALLPVCERDVSQEFNKGFYDFATRLYKRVALDTDYHFVISQYSVWLALASITEGLEGEAQKAVFKALNFPEMVCQREKYYRQAMGLETVGRDVVLARKRLLVLDPSVQLNPSWIDKIKNYGFLETYTAPILNNPVESAEMLRKMFGLRMPMLPQGCSIYMDCLDFSGLWQTAFSDADIEKNAPFYNDAGEIIGRVDYMRMRKRVKVAFYPLTNAKVLELPIGFDGRYSLLLMMNMGANNIQKAMSIFTNNIIIDIMDNMIESLIPLEIAIPRFSLSTELDLTKALQEIGVAGWNDGKTLSPSPVAVIQRVSLTFDSRGSEAYQPSSSILSPLADLATGLSSAVGRDFIANRPLMFGLIDAKTRIPLFSGAYSKPGLV